MILLRRTVMALEKDQKLKKQVTEKLQAEKTAEYKKKLVEERETDRLRQIEEIKKGRTYIDPDSGHEVDRWKEVMRKAEKVVNEAAMSYNDWRASMSSLISLCTYLNLAISQSKNELLTHVGYGLLSVGRMAYDPLKEKLSGQPEITLPDLQYLVECSDDNKIGIKSLQRFEGDDLGASINETFKAGFDKWLGDLNYKESDEPGKWVEKDTGEVLTKERFNELKNDPARGLGAILSDHFDLNLEERPSPKP